MANLGIEIAAMPQNGAEARPQRGQQRDPVGRRQSRATQYGRCDFRIVENEQPHDFDRRLGMLKRARAGSPNGMRHRIANLGQPDQRRVRRGNAPAPDQIDQLPPARLRAERRRHIGGKHGV